MLRKLLILLVSLSFSQFAAADIATDIADGKSTLEATTNAFNADPQVSAEDALVALIVAGIKAEDARKVVSEVYSLTTAQMIVIITAAINSLEPDPVTEKLDTELLAKLTKLLSIGALDVATTGTTGPSLGTGTNLGGGSASPN